METNRSKIVLKLKDNLRNGIPVLAASAGMGLCAHAEEVAGVDLIYTDMAAYHRMQGRSSIYGDQPIMNAHDYILKAADNILPVVKDTPVIAGVMGNDNMRIRSVFLEELKRCGYAGVINSPSMIGLILQLGTLDEDEAMAPSGWSFKNETNLVSQAHELDMIAVGNVYVEWQAREMAEAGADIIVADMGITVGGRCGGEERFARTMSEAIEYISAIEKTVHDINKEIIVCCHGGLLNTPEAVEYIYKNVAGIQGFFGASAIERIPIEAAIEQHIREFNEIRY